MATDKVVLGDCLGVLKTMQDQSVQCCITSPPYYGLRDYGTAKWEGGDSSCDHIEKKNLERDCSGGFSGRDKGTRGEQPSASSKIQYKDICGKCGAIRIDSQIGLEQMPGEYVTKLVDVFREVKRVLRDDGTLWLNLGDSYVSGATGSQENNKSTLRGGITTQIEAGKRPDKNIPGLKHKDLIGIPWMVAFALRADGWYLRSDIIWAKPNPMPESVKDRPTKSHEYIFLLSKSQKYYYDYESILELATGYDGRKDTRFKGSIKSYDGVVPGGKPQTFAQKGHERWQYKNLQECGQKPNTIHESRLRGKEYVSPVRSKRDVWFISTKPYKDAHFATFPEDLIKTCVLAGCPKGGIVLDPFTGSGTTGIVAVKHGRGFIGIELNPNYVEMAMRRINNAKQQMRLPI